MLSQILVLALSVSAPNPRCPVTGFPVDNHLVYHSVTVKGRPYFVYDRESAARLRACPECYLKEDGMPRNNETQSRR